VRSRQLAGRSVSAVGFGGAKLSLRAERPSETDAIRTIHAALDAGITLLDTADVYALDRADMGHSERLFTKALHTWSGDADDVLVVTKGGQHWEDGRAVFDGGAAAIRAACIASLAVLGVERIGVYLLHRLPRDYSPRRPVWGETFAESVETLRELKAEGLIEHVGLSNVDVAMTESALRTLELVAIENPIGVLAPVEPGQLALCEREDMALLGWGPLKGTVAANPAPAAGPVRDRVEVMREIGEAHGVSLQQVTLAWELAASPRVIPLIGARRPESVVGSAAAVDLALTEEELRTIERAGACGSVDE
jgi:aryl-alcohol dehydrogenase-like predicted oxidoreductase